MYLGNEIIDGQISNRIIGYHGDGHILTIGPTRCGKSRRLIVPNLLYEIENSALVVDVKGELSMITGMHRASKGGKVVALDPFGVLAARNLEFPTAGFNPMAALDPASDNFVDDSMMIAEALVQIGPELREPHFAESAQDLMAALVMWAKWQRKDKATLHEVRQMICQPVERIKATVTLAVKENAHPAIIRKLAKFLNPAKDNRELDSVLSTAQTQSRFLDSPGIIRNLTSGGIDFAMLKRETLTVYLVLPPERIMTHAKWLRLVISSAMTAMQKTLKVTGRPDVIFLLDEFPQLGRMPTIETAVSLNAGYGVKVWVAVQHLGQLKEHYGDNWETFLSAGCVTAFAPRDVMTRDHLTKLIGTGTKMLRSVSHHISGGGASITDSMQKEDLVSPYQWREMILGEQWAFIPTDKGQFIKRIHSRDFTELPEVISGKINVGLVATYQTGS